MERALAKDPTRFASMQMMDRIDVAEGKFQPIEDRLRVALEARPKDEQLIIRMAQVLAQRGRRGEAIAFLEAKGKEAPDSIRLLHTLIRLNIATSKPEEVRRLAEAALERGLGGQTEVLDVAGDAFMALKDYPKAIEAYAKLAQRVSTVEGPLLKMARAQFLSGQLDATQTTLERILEAQPANTLANRSILDLYLRRNDADAAMAAADRAGKTVPVLGIQMRAEVLRRTQRLDRAIEEIRAGMAQYPVSELAQQSFRLLLEAERRDEAKKLLASWLVDHQDDPEALQLLSTAQIVDKEYEAAAVYLERAYSLLPNSPVVLNNLAWIRYELQRPGAVAVARRAYRLAPNAPAIADTLGWILVREGETEEGIKLLYTANEAAPTIGDIAYHLAFALEKAGKRKEAVNVLEASFKEGSEVTFDQDGDNAKTLLSKLKGS
jgi:cellulose synthase operon protein C